MLVRANRTLSVLRRKPGRLLSGRSPGWEGGWNRPGRFTFPDPKIEWYNEAVNPRSQWRDRAGFTPDFPFTPLRAPEIPTLS